MASRPLLRRCALAAAAALAGAARAAAPPPPAPVPPAALAPAEPISVPSPELAIVAPGAPATSPPPAEEHHTWLDRGHALIDEALGGALQVDRIFSDERQLDAERNRSFVRWRNDFRYGTDTRLTYRTGLVADLRFPGLNKWLEGASIFIAGENDASAADLREAPGAAVTQPPPPGPVSKPGRVAAELRYALFETFRVKADLGAGFLFQLPPGVVGRVRLRYAEPVGRLFLLRLGYTLFWRTDLHLGNTLDASVEREVAPRTVLRLASGATANQVEREKGLQWATELGLVHALGPATAISIAAAASGVTLPTQRADLYRTYMRYRRDVFRRWIFVELEPEVSWPIVVPPDHRTRVEAFTFRLEAQFDGEFRRAAARSRPRSEPGPEPRDPD